jgi:tRNA(Ile)-lysidine synthase
MVSPFAEGLLLRPLLNFNRQSLLDYAHRNNLRWIEDESNVNVNFNRNFIRHELMPIIRQRWPSITATLHRTAQHCAETNTLLQKTLPETFKAEISQRLSINYLKMFDEAQQRNILRFWIQQNNVCLPTTAKLQELQRSMLCARIDANPCIVWGKVEVRRHRGELHIMERKLPTNSDLIIPWSLKKDLELPHNLGVVRLDFLTKDWPTKQLHSITVRFRKGGERCKIKGRQGTHKLKKLFQEWSVPTWQRDRVPLIYMRENIIAVYPYCLCELPLSP